MFTFLLVVAACVLMNVLVMILFHCLKNLNNFMQNVCSMNFQKYLLRTSRVFVERTAKFVMVLTLYANKNNLYTFTNETICLRLRIVDLRPKLRDWIEKFLGDNRSYFKRVSLKLHLWLIYSTLRSLGINQHCLEAQIASIVALVDAYDHEKQWLQKHQNVSLSLTTYVFKSRILDSGTNSALSRA